MIEITLMFILYFIFSNIITNTIITFLLVLLVSQIYCMENIKLNFTGTK